MICFAKIHSIIQISMKTMFRGLDRADFLIWNSNDVMHSAFFFFRFRRLVVLVPGRTNTHGLLQPSLLRALSGIVPRYACSVRAVAELHLQRSLQSARASPAGDLDARRSHRPSRRKVHADQ